MFFDSLSPLKTAFSLLAHYWWTFTPFLLFFGALDGWLFYLRKKYIFSIKWVLLEVKPPPDVQKSPKIAENIFSGLHGAYFKPMDWKDKFFKGAVQPWFSFEIVGNGGEIGFFVRIPENFRNHVESIIFAQYPDAEIKIADDYVKQLPEYLPDDNYDLFGTDLVFTKPDAFPIKTHPFFEEESGKDEFKRTDPLAPLAEIMSTLEPGEHIWVQLVVRATSGGWAKEAKTEVDKLIGREPKIKRGFVGQAVDFVDQFLPGGMPPAEEKKKDEFSMMKLTGGQKFVLDQVEHKIAQLGFKSTYRFLYIARKDRFHGTHVAAISGFFKQFYLNNLNSFTLYRKTRTIAKGFLYQLFPSDKGFGYKKELFRRKWNLYKNYKDRFFTDRLNIFCTEELATLFHLPGIGLKAPAFPRVEAKKGQPPAGLPTGQ